MRMHERQIKLYFNTENHGYISNLHILFYFLFIKCSFLDIFFYIKVKIQ